MTSDHIISTITLEIVVACDTIVAFVIPLLVLLMSSPVMWR
jgi:hypothetical protein